MNEEKYDRLCVILEELYLTGSKGSYLIDKVEWDKALENEGVTSDDFDIYCSKKISHLYDLGDANG